MPSQECVFSLFLDSDSEFCRNSDGTLAPSCLYWEAGVLGARRNSSISHARCVFLMPRARLAASLVTIYAPYSLLLWATAARPVTDPGRHLLALQACKHWAVPPICCKGNWGEGSSREQVTQSRRSRRSLADIQRPFKPWLWGSLAVWPWAGWLSSLSLSLPKCETKETSPSLKNCQSKCRKTSPLPKCNDRHGCHLISAHRCWVLCMHYSS